MNDLIRIFNTVRYPSISLSVDEELIYLLGRCRVKQFIKEKHNRYGPKLFICSGGNEGTSHKGYYHQAQLYRGKLRNRVGVFATYGKGYEFQAWCASEAASLAQKNG